MARSKEAPLLIPRTQRFALAAAVVAITLSAAGCGTNRSQAVSTTPVKTNGQAAVPRQQWSAPPALALNPKDHYQAVVRTTAGRFTIDLFAAQSPNAVNNFVFLANHNFYDNNQFFRVLKSFVIQTGDPLNTGLGGPGYTWNAQLPPPYPYQPGIVAMAVSGTNPNTNGSQFFICTGPLSAQLNQEPLYTEVGRVVSGMSTVTKIADGQVKVNPATNEKSAPLHPFHIISVTIETTPT